MDTETLQKKHDRLVEAVHRMRGHQKEYFKYRARSDLDIARRWEREVDKLIQEEVKVKKSKQQQFF